MTLEQLRIDRRSSGRRRPRAWLGRGLLLLVLAVPAYLFWTPLAGLVDRVRLPEVEVARATAPASAADAVRGKAANGYVVAARRAALSADTPGRIVEMRVTEGSVVKRGDIVARLYSDEQEAAVKIAEAEVLVAEGQLPRAEAELQVTKAELARLQRQQHSAAASLESANALLSLRTTQLERARQLFEEGVITQSELDDAVSAHDVAVAEHTAAGALLRAAEAAGLSGESRVKVAELDVGTARAQLEVAQATLERARATLDKTIVRAPFDGVVVLKDAEVGEVVSPNSQGGSNARGSVVTMVDFASLEVQANVPETSLEAVRVGAPTSIYLDAYRDARYDGRVSRIWPTADRQKGTVEVRIVFDKPDERLRPEMGVRVVFLPEGTEPAAPAAPVTGVLVPQEAVVREGGRDRVFVVERDRVSMREVELGERLADRVAITSGLEEGESVVVHPPSSLSHGGRVRIRE
ncbi:MAG: efflux RND transporter periplasmic adaptor subunit [Planctomycetota bacterium]